MYIDGDKDYPTLNGTGTEDYIGSAWGQNKFINNYTGCTIANDTLLQWAFYRYHIPDPIYFNTDFKATIQQIGGNQTKNVAKFQIKKSPLVPISTNNSHFYKKDSIVNLNAPNTKKGWTNFYRSDDVSATAYFYLNKPFSNLPQIQPVSIRIKDVNRKISK